MDHRRVADRRRIDPQPPAAAAPASKPERAADDPRLFYGQGETPPDAVMTATIADGQRIAEQLAAAAAGRLGRSAEADLAELQAVLDRTPRPRPRTLEAAVEIAFGELFRRLHRAIT